MSSAGQTRFPALGVRNYRLFWTGGLVTNSGRWILHITSAYVIFRITGSATWVGITGFANFGSPVAIVKPPTGDLTAGVDTFHAAYAEGY